jgi:haloalkane dehalogenase
VFTLRGDDKEPTMPNETPSFAQPYAHVDAAHGRLAYYRFGQGPDVVLIHGWPLHSATFRHIVPELSRSFTLHLFDLPGTGRTEWRGPVELASHHRVVRSAIDAIGLSDYALLAHDSGGLIARHLAAEDPRVTGLVLGNTEIPGHQAWLVQAYAWAVKIPGASSLLRRAIQIGAVRRSFLGFGGCFRDPAYVDGEFGDLFVRPIVTSRSVAERQFDLLRGFNFGIIDALGEVHARIKAPTLCIWGTDDPFFPIAKARRILGEFRGGAELVEIPGAKLLAHEDHPDAFVAHAAPFLARCARRPAPPAA